MRGGKGEGVEGEGSHVNQNKHVLDNSHNRKVSRQCTDRGLQRKQGTVLNITGSYKYTNTLGPHDLRSCGDVGPIGRLRLRLQALRHTHLD